MKKTLFVLFGLVVLAGCSSYDYYKGDVRYVQDGEDCIFTSTEAGYRYSSDIRELNADKEIVYRNTMCRDLYLNDVAGQVQRTERQVLTTVAPKVVKSDCGCCKKKTKSGYSTDVETLEKLREHHPIIDKILPTVKIISLWYAYFKSCFSLKSR